MEDHGFITKCDDRPPSDGGGGLRSGGRGEHREPLQVLQQGGDACGHQGHGRRVRGPPQVGPGGGPGPGGPAAGGRPQVEGDLGQAPQGRGPGPGDDLGPRYSIAFFAQANSDVLIESPQGSYPPITAGDFVQERIRANYAR